MNKLYLVRHGQTLFNLQGKTQGWCDSPLTDLGIRQAEAVREYIKNSDITFDVLYSSTLGRAEDTAKIISDLPLTRHKGLREWSFGAMEAEHEYLQRVPRRPDQKTHEDFFVKWGGESAEDLLKRIDSTINEIVSENKGKNILAVCHGGAMWVYFLSKKDVTQEKIDETRNSTGNCCIMEYNIHDNGEVEFVQILNPVKDLK